MLGTGIASADEDVNPDRPASPLDGSVRVPVHMDNNALGTPLGQKDLPSLDKELRVDVNDLTGAVPMADQATPAVAPVLDQAQSLASPVAGSLADKANPTLDQVNAPLAAKAEPMADKINASTDKANIPPLPALPTLTIPDMDTAFEGNRVDGDLVAPVDISGNAIALLGEASVVNDSSQSYSSDESVVTDGSGGFLAGNVVDLDWALPMQITGNAISGGGQASSTSTASQDTAVTSDVTTDGSDGVLSGNVLAGHWATPVQVNGNALTGAGEADANSTADTTATAGGPVLTSGQDSFGGGNIGALPVATPVEVNGNALAGAGDADGSSDTTATATAGGLREGLYGVPTYLETNGDPAVGAGNIVAPAVSGPILYCGNATAGAGTAEASCITSTTTTAGGTTRSSGAGSIISGAAAVAPVAMPVEIFGNAVAGAGDADAIADNTVTPTAGGDSYTRGHDSVLSGSVASVAPSGPIDIFGNAAAGAGSASASAAQAADLGGSGHTGTTGDNSVGGGNSATAPIVVPVEGFGNVAGAAGSAEATASEVKTTANDGGGSTDDDDGILASNNIATPVAGAVQAFGNGAGAIAFTDANAITDTEVVSGGDSEATGTAGLGSGNIGQAPVALPAQLFGNGASVLAGGDQNASGTTSMTAGGDAYSDGQDGALSGNVVSSPLASAGQAFGESVAVLGHNESNASSSTTSTAGGDVLTDGTSGFGTGNVVSPQALANAQSFAAAVSGVGGINSADADSTSALTSGGDIDTAGDDGFLAGNLLDVPAAGVAQPFGDAVAALGSHSEASGDNTSSNSSGGTSTTSGTPGSLSGIDGTVPVGANAPVYDVPVEVLAEAITNSYNASEVFVGEDAGQLNIPISGGGMSPTELPMIMGGSAQRSLPADHVPFAGSFSGVLDGFAGAGRSDLPVSGDLPVLNDLTDVTAVLPVVPAVPAAPGLPGVPAVPAAPGLPAVPAVGGLADVSPNLPTAPAVPQANPTAMVPAVGGADLTEIVPNVPSAADVPVVQTPTLGNLPVGGARNAPAMPGLDSASTLDNPSLSATRAALDNLFTIHPMA